jgi:hypothetical protein
MQGALPLLLQPGEQTRDVSAGGEGLGEDGGDAERGERLGSDDDS